ncbi:hypothetical protein ACQ0QQ_00710 [Lysinibacillus sphaericus]
MAVLSTGPIENPAVGGVRQVTQITVIADNRSSASASSVLIQGFILDGTRTLYVSELVNLAANQVVTRNYFGNVNAYEYVFTTSGPAEDSTQVSLWGKSASGAVRFSQRLVSDEILGQS